MRKQRWSPHGHPLPSRMHWKNGTFYHVNNRRVPKWIKLSKNYDFALDLWAEVEGLPWAETEGTSDAALLKHIGKMVQNSKTRALRRSLDHDISKAYLLDVCARAGWRCQLTRLRFSLVKTEYSRRPWAPSLDRIDSGRGYTTTNVRVVCAAVNYAMNEFGLPTLLRISAALNSAEQRKALKWC